MKKQFYCYLIAAFGISLLPACDIEKETASIIVKPPSPTGSNHPPKRTAGSSSDEREKKHDAEVKKAVLVRFTQSVMLDDALKLAKAQNKPVFVDFYTDWCAPCKLMDEYVFTDPPFAAYINTNFVSYKFDCSNFDADPYMKRYKIQGYPTLMFISPTGKILASHFGGLSYTAMKKMAQDALAKYRTGA
jgi:thiol:disulfide interchange protein